MTIIQRGRRMSPDGTQIAFESNRDGNFEIYVVEVKGEKLTRLTSNAANDRQPPASNGTSEVLSDGKMKVKI